MPQRRFRFIASDNYTPRSNTDVPSIGQLLKKLKTSNRDIRSSQKQLGAEIHLLERVYYKGKNQHGLSLFWRNVVATRRMASRVHEVNIPRLLEILAGMFHDEEFGGTKVFSGAWTRIPPPENVAKIIERLLDIVKLLKSASTEFLKAYRAFCLFMPTTAFLQLTIVLVGIVARANALASSLLESISEIIPCVYATFEALQPPTPLHRRISGRLKGLSSDTPASPMQTDAPVPTETTAKVPMHIDDEDIGFTVARAVAQLPLLNNTTLPSPPTLPDSIITAEPSIALETVIERSPSPAQPPLEVPTPNFLEEQTVAKSEDVPRDARITTKKAKKRKKARDEIDDIFG
ncbi:hypothetical protein RhiJN_28070 [Ceratobasidium sp. AG-Ba]|nr:hypothetical protein RhiJN_28070 [Ceratobasidium sp. AG-Ba]